MKPGTSCFIFTHNQASFIEERLRSLESQTLQPNEIFIVDDGSSDNTQNTILSFLEHASTDFVERTQCLFFEKPTGTASGRWLEMLQAGYENLWLLEGDDSSEYNFLSRTTEILTKHPSVGFVWAWSRFVNEKGSFLGLDSNFLESKPFNGHDLDFILTDGLHHGPSLNSNSLVFFNPFPNLGANLFRTEALVTVLKENWGELKNLRLAGDWLIYSRILESYDTYVITKPLNIFRRHSAANSYRMKNVEHLSEFSYMQNNVASRQKDVIGAIFERQRIWAKYVSTNLGLT